LLKVPNIIMPRDKLGGVDKDVVPSQGMTMDDLLEEFEAKVVETVAFLERGIPSQEECEKHGVYGEFEDRFVFFWKGEPLVHMIYRINPTLQMPEFRMEVTLPDEYKKLFRREEYKTKPKAVEVKP